ncbi:MAG: Ig-like domain-containing protein [Gemmatimonadaceae bacterium]|nr:Ig-like domain-containing protein [Gemmatimonadaceae bacterium]
MTAIGAGSATISATADAAKAQASVTVLGTVRLLNPNPARVEGMIPGTERQISVEVRADPGVSQALEWISGDPAIASVTQVSATTAKVVGVTSGSTTVTVRSLHDRTQQLAIAVIVVPIVGCTLSPTQFDIFVADTKQVTATCDPAGLALAWTSSNPSIASVSSTGQVTGASAGEVSVTARAIADATKSALTLVRVTGRVQSVSITPTTASLVVGQTLQVTGSVTADEGVVRSVNYRTSNTARATVSNSGVVTATGAGSVLISAIAVADSQKFASATLSISGVVRSVTVLPNPTSVALNGTRALTAMVTADPGVSTAVVWSSSSPALAGVDPSSGVVTGVAFGNATITATSVDPSVSGSTRVTVGGVQSVTVSPKAGIVGIPGTLQVLATVIADSGVSTATGWTSTNPAVATVSSTGLVTAVQTGTTQIVATSLANTQRSDTATITVGRVISVSLPSVPSVLVGTSLAIVPTVVADPGVSTALLWTSSNAGILTVNSVGNLTCVARGTATVTARSAIDLTKSSATLVTCIGVVSVVLSTSADSIRVGGTRQLSAIVTADPGVPQTVTWVSNNSAVATISASGQVVGVSLGTALASARSTVDQAKAASATIKVGSACAIPLPIAVGVTVNATINASSCNGIFEHVAYTLSTTTAFRMTGSAPFSFDFSPLVSSKGNWYFGNLNPGPFNAYVLASAGTFRSTIASTAAGVTGNVSFSAVPWDMSGCPPIFTSTGISSAPIPMTNVCGSAYQPNGTTTGTFYSISLAVVPPLNVGEIISITAVATGFEPRIDLLGGSAFVAKSVAAPGVFSATLNYTSTSFMFYRFFISSLNPLATGSVRIIITGPLASSIASGVGSSAARVPSVRIPVPPK